MKTKQQRGEEIKKAHELLEKSRSIIFTDFSGVGTVQIKKLKNDLKKLSAQYRITKKRLLGVAFKKLGIELNPRDVSKSQMGLVFTPEEIISVAGTVYKFSRELAKEKKEFKILGAYDLKEKSFLTAEEFTAIAKLPSREVLLAQLVGVIAGSIRAFMYVLQEKAKKMVEQTSN